MDFIDRINELANRIPKQIDHCLTEEATKNAMVMPFINALGYDVFNPFEVVPEFVADVGIKKGEKIDYAIHRDGKPVILFECKWANADLNIEHASQLYRYFAALPDVRFGILTNGVNYRFYTDLDKPNVMDSAPFFVFNMLEYDDRHVNELKKFTKSAFDLTQIMTTASELKYTAAIRAILEREFVQPSEELVRLLAAQVYDGKMTAKALAQFAPLVERTLKRFISDQVNIRLKAALDDTSKGQKAQEPLVPEPMPDATKEAIKEIVTTQEELEGFLTVKAILREVIDITRLHMKDAKSYCAILLDNNNRRPVCRLHFNRGQKHIGLFDKGKDEERVPIDGIDDIYKHSDRLRATIALYGQPAT